MISAGLFFFERQEKERHISLSNRGLNKRYEDPTLITPQSETLIKIFPFVGNLALRSAAHSKLVARRIELTCIPQPSSEVPV